MKRGQHLGGPRKEFLRHALNGIYESYTHGPERSRQPLKDMESSLPSTIDRQEARLIAMEQKAHKSECNLRKAIDHQEAKIMDLQTGAQSASKQLETLVAASSRKDEQIKLLKRELNAQEQYS